MNEDGENLCMTREYTAKAHFISDLHGNGYKVHFVALTDKYDEECAKYYERLETKRRRAAIHRECERKWREHDKKFAEDLEKRLAAEEETAEEPAADQEPETSENYIAWCGMIESDVITEEHETLSEAIDEVETKYDKEEQRALGVTYCRLLCTAGQWLECLEEKKIEDIYFFDKGRVIYDNRSGNYFRIDSELDEVRGAYWCTMVELDDTGDISAELSAGWMTKSEVNRCTDI